MKHNFEAEILQAISLPSQSKRRKLIIIVGPCRSGTTALSNVFSPVCECHLQPIKYFRKKCFKNQTIDKIFSFPLNDRFILTKETIGLFNSVDFFDPVDIYLKKGILCDDIRLVVVFRDPVKTWISCKSIWGNIDLELFVESFKYIEKIRKDAEVRGIYTISFFHEAIRDNNPEDVIRKLIESLNIPYINYHKEMINWTNFDDLISNPNIYIYGNPSKNILRGMSSGSSYTYIDKEYNRITSQEKLALKNAGLYDLYVKHVKMSKIKLSLK